MIGPERITVWVCPKEDCGNFYGSSSAGDLSRTLNHDMKGQVTFPRSRCPDCGSERARVTIPGPFLIELKRGV